MRVETAAAVFITVRQIIKCAAAVLAQRIQRAIAEKTVEIIGICTWMAGEVFTFFVCKIRIVMGHKDNLLKENAHPDQKQGTQNSGGSAKLSPVSFRTSRFRQAYRMHSTYLTYPHNGGFTVTDSSGLAPDSVSCTKQVRAYLRYLFVFIINDTWE